MDAKTTASLSKTHSMSDSDSDVTIEPPDYCSSLDGSQDLFDSDTTVSKTALSFSTMESTSLNRSKQKASSPSTPRQKTQTSTLVKKASKTHDISDSDSDSADDPRLSKRADHWKTKNRTSPSVHQPKSGVALRPTVQTSKSVTKVSSDRQPKSGGASTPAVQTTKSLTKISPDHRPKSGGASTPAVQTSKSLTKVSLDLSPGAASGHRVSSAHSSNSSWSSSGSGSSTTGQAEGTEGSAARSACKYGSRCYRTNPEHFQEFYHAGEKGSKRKEPSSSAVTDTGAAKKTRKDEGTGAAEECRQTSDFKKTVADVLAEFQPLSFFLTKVSGIDDRFNQTGAVSVKDILSPLMGELQSSCQFNFMFDIPWLVKQYPQQFRDKPLLLVHGEQGNSEAELREDAAPFPHISFCRAKLEMMYGTHHTKMMLLLYDCGMRVVIHTANMISGDWHQKTQGVWISPLFPKLRDSGGAASGKRGDSPTNFKADLLAYIAAYRTVPLKQWEQHIQQHDMSSASVYIIGSIPGRHTGGQRSAWGHLKLRRVLQEVGPEKKDVGSWPVIGQFSSIGSLGASPDQWLCDEWLCSLSQCKGIMATPLPHSKLQLVYPSKENVRLCLEGYGGGGCLPYSIKTAKKQIYLNNFVRKWGSESRGRTEAIPHIKTYTRVSPDYTQAAWFLVTSANLSKAAWGALEKQKTQLMIRSYEMGVLLLPGAFGGSVGFPVARTAEEVCSSKQVLLPFPYDLPPPTYQKGDRIWMWDVPCVDLPDTHGKKYCPRL